MSSRSRRCSISECPREGSALSKFNLNGWVDDGAVVDTGLFLDS